MQALETTRIDLNVEFWLFTIDRLNIPVKALLTNETNISKHNVELVRTSWIASILFSNTSELHIIFETGMILKIGVETNIKQIFQNEQHAAKSSIGKSVSLRNIFSSRTFYTAEKIAASTSTITPENFDYVSSILKSSSRYSTKLFIKMPITAITNVPTFYWLKSVLKSR